jgi:predicted O-methyltransferase YrrM
MGLRTALGIKKKIAPKPSYVDQKAFAGKDFTVDWTSMQAGEWVEPLMDLPHSPARVLEIGSYEGRSAITFITMLPDASVTCIDIFCEAEYEKRFDANMAEYGSRIEKIKSRAQNALPTFLHEGRKYDVVYIDGDHTRKGTLTNSILSWPLLMPGGVLIWDDYLWEKQLPSANRPKQAVDWFLEAFDDELTVLHKGYQVIVRKKQND